MTDIKVRLTSIIKILSLIAIAAIVSGCQGSNSPVSPTMSQTVPHKETWGIYEVDLATQNVKLIYSTPSELYASALRLDSAGSKFVFAMQADGTSDEDMEIYSIDADGSNLTRLTKNQVMDVYPAWSPDGTRIAFLSRSENDLDIFVMNADGSDVNKLYDSGFNDADIDWAGDSIVFTSRFAVWKMNADGTKPAQITDPPDRGQWGKANLPAGDYDPRLSLDGSKVVFERLEDTSLPNGGYNIFVVDSDGTGETRLTDNGYAQGLASWSHSGDMLAYVVAAIDGQGKYDIYLMNSDGTDNRKITPDYFPVSFLCHSPVFSIDDSHIYFIGQWWE